MGGKTDKNEQGYYNDLTDKVTLRVSMMAKPREQWTPEMKVFDAQLKANPRLEAEVANGVRIAAQLVRADDPASRTAVQDRYLSDYMKALKTGDRRGAAQAWEQMSPEVQRDIQRGDGVGYKQGDNKKNFADILADKNSTIFEKLSAIGEMVLDAIKTAFSGLTEPAKVQDRKDEATPPKPHPPTSDHENVDPSPAPSFSPELNAEQMQHIENMDAILSSITNDVEDDLYNRDGGTNEVEMAGQRLAALAPFLTASFNDASGLTDMINTAILKRDFKEKEEAQISTLNRLEQKKQTDAEKAREDADDLANDMQQSQQAQRQRDQAATLSQSDLDAREWSGDSSMDWAIQAFSGSRQSWYEGAKATRRKLDQLANDNGWTDAQRAHEERLLSDFMKAVKDGDKGAAEEAWNGMRAETQQNIEQQKNKSVQVDSILSRENVIAANSINDQAAAKASILAKADMLASASLSEGAISPPASGPKESALSKPPEIALAAKFATAASPDTPLVEPDKQVQLAAATIGPKAAALPVLSQEYSL